MENEKEGWNIPLINPGYTEPIYLKRLLTRIIHTLKLFIYLFIVHLLSFVYLLICFISGGNDSTSSSFLPSIFNPQLSTFGPHPSADTPPQPRQSSTPQPSSHIPQPHSPSALCSDKAITVPCLSGCLSHSALLQTHTRYRELSSSLEYTIYHFTR